jgi:hypothetical protein
VLRAETARRRASLLLGRAWMRQPEGGIMGKESERIPGASVFAVLFH